VKKGQRTDTGWKPEVIATAQATFTIKGLKVLNKQQFETKRDSWKKSWKLFHLILGITGFGINEITGCIDADNECWERVLLLLLAIDRADQRGDVPAYIEFTRLN
jgi:Myb/SANT-like DNA-binding domain